MIRIASICLAIYWLIICVATHLPKSAMPSLGWSDKVYHAGAFMGLAFLLAWAFPARDRRIRHLIFVFVVGLTYGIADELTQQFIPGRHCDFWDAVADGFGVILGICIYTISRQILTSQTWGRQLIDRLSH